MARPSTPWKWEARGGWYAWVNGSRRRLCDLDEGVKRATTELRKLLNRAEAESERGAVPVVGELMVLYLRDVNARRDRGELDEPSREGILRRIGGFAEMHGDLPADQVRQHHVESWLASKTGWGATSRHDGVGAIKTLFRWGKRMGHIPSDPLSDMKKPTRPKRRDRIPTAAQAEAALSATANQEQLDILTFIAETGCRPKEARTMKAEQLDLANRLVLLKEHKTAKKTGKPRKVFLTDAAAEIAGRLAALRPEGPIFLNSKGRPWTKDALASAMRNIRARAGLGKETVAYGFRHRLATSLVEQEVPLPIISKILGHESIKTTEIYLHTDEMDDAAREALNRKTRGPGA